MDLRWYQAEAKAAIYDFLQKKNGNPCAVLPTGSGKTPLLASICSDVVGAWGGRVLVLAHVRELLEQSRDKLRRFMNADKVGVYSAGLNSRDTRHEVLVAGIQSVYKRAYELGKIDLIIVDEAHLIPPDGEGMYRTFLEASRMANPRVRIVGLTATPYRLDCGMICGPDRILSEVCYDAGIRELIAQGFLCRLKTRAGTAHPDLSGIHTRGGEFVESEMASRMEAISVEAVKEIVRLTADRKSILVFCAGVAHGQSVQKMLEAETGESVGFVHGETPSDERRDLLSRFKGEGLYPIRYLVNVNVLTTGFDAPNVDGIVLLRATLSPGLYYQMVGRGLRMHTGKDECAVLDYGENVVRHGPIDAMRIDDKEKGQGDGEAPAKECPECRAVVLISLMVCPECGFRWPEPEPKIKPAAGNESILSESEPKFHTVRATRYYIHRKKDAPDAPPTMRVEYEAGAMCEIFREWLCFEHSGFARRKAELWWAARSNEPCPATVADAVTKASAGAVVETLGIKCIKKPGEKFGSIVAYEVADKSNVVTTETNYRIPDDEIPF